MVAETVDRARSAKSPGAIDVDAGLQMSPLHAQ